MRAQFIKRLKTAIDIQKRMQRGFPCRTIYLLWDRKLQKFALFTDLMKDQFMKERLDESISPCIINKKTLHNKRYTSMDTGLSNYILNYAN
jgi:hypothetical protein